MIRKPHDDIYFAGMRFLYAGPAGADGGENKKPEAWLPVLMETCLLCMFRFVFVVVGLAL